MGNVLKLDKKIQVIGALVEGNSIRSTERMTGVHRDTIMRLGVRVGEGCLGMMDSLMRNMTCKSIEIDEIWGFVGKKKKNLRNGEKEKGLGDVWTFVSFDAETKVVPCFRVGIRDAENTNAFIQDLETRMKDRIQITTDQMHSYYDAIHANFGNGVDYGQVLKTFSSPGTSGYSKGILTNIEKHSMFGNPDMAKVSTSYVERQNLTMRMHMRRLTRLTNGFSKKLDNFKAAVGLHFGYYNLVRIHSSLKVTPGLAAGITNKLWSVSDLVERADG